MAIALKAGAMVGLMAVGLMGCGSAGIDPQNEQEETSASSEDLRLRRIHYLALGDSIAFGFNPLNPTPADPTSYTGYPEVIGQIHPNSVVNASCPGETSGSFLSSSAPDNGCRQWKHFFSLHADYEGTQIDFAEAYVHTHPETKFISINLGANDLFVLQQTCLGDLACIQAGLPITLGTYGQNLATIFTRLRLAGFTGKFVTLTTYATNYNDPLAVPALTAMNQIASQVTDAFDGKVADGFGTFQFFARKSSGDACAAGLLIKKPDGTCDIHPSEKGRDILAVSVVAAALRCDHR